MSDHKQGVNKNKWIKYTVIGALAAGGVALVGMAMGRTASANSIPAEEKVFRVETQTVEPTGSEVYLDYTGLVQPAEMTQVTFSAVGMIEKIHVEEGDRVTKGQLLAELNAEDAQRQQENMSELTQQTDTAVKNAQAARDQAQKDYEEACKPASEADLNEARTKRDAAQSSRNEKQAELDSLNAQVNKDKTELDAAQSEYDAAYAPLAQAEENLKAKKEAYNTAKKQADDAQEKLTKAEEKATQAQAEADRLNADPDATQEQKTQAQQELTMANQELVQAQGEKASAQTGLTQAQADKEAAQAARNAAAADPELAQARTNLTEAQAQYAQSQGLAGTAQTQLSALDTELNARKAAYDALAAQGADSSEAKARKRQLDSAENTLSIAKSAQITARNSYQSAQSDVIDCELKAPSDGYVVKVVGNEGGMATPIAPTVVIGSKRAMVQFGVSQNDVREISEGGAATVTIGDQVFEGVIRQIGTIPDTTTRTYMVDVDIVANTDEFYIGEMAQVRLDAGQRSGTWLPLNSVLNDGEDYVYVVENNRAVRRVVQIVDVSDDKLLVKGLDTGSQIIVEGMKTVRSGSAVITG